MKNKKINYEDYKYVYTGYKEYCKEHNIKLNSNSKLTKKPKIVKPKEEIIHDHRLQFDFNNPNQHTHDYSFDFNTQNNTTKKTSTYNKSTTQTKTTPTTTTKTTQTRSYSYPTNTTANTSTYNKKTTKTNASGCVVMFVIFFIMFFFTIIGIISESYDDDYYYSSEYEEEDEYYYYNGNSTYNMAIEDYISALRNEDYTILLDSITPEEKEYDYGLSWENDINSIINTEHNINTLTYSYKLTRAYSYQELISLEDSFNYAYNSEVTFDEAYYISIDLYVNNKLFPKSFLVGKINTSWYLLSVF